MKFVRRWIGQYRTFKKKYPEAFMLETIGGLVFVYGAFIAGTQAFEAIAINRALEEEVLELRIKNSEYRREHDVLSVRVEELEELAEREAYLDRRAREVRQNNALVADVLRCTEKFDGQLGISLEDEFQLAGVLSYFDDTSQVFIGSWKQYREGMREGKGYFSVKESRDRKTGLEELHLKSNRRSGFGRTVPKEQLETAQTYCQEQGLL